MIPVSAMLFIDRVLQSWASYNDNVAIKGSLGVGAIFERGSTFIEGSKDLTVTGSVLAEAVTRLATLLAEG